MPDSTANWYLCPCGLCHPEGVSCTGMPAVTASDPVNHPAHYMQGKLECIDAIEGLGLGFHEAQVLKYLCRWRHKDKVRDLLKAQWYLRRLITKEGGNPDAPNPNMAACGIVKVGFPVNSDDYPDHDDTDEP